METYYKSGESEFAYKHFKLENMECVKYLIEHNDCMIELDLQDAYFIISIVSDCKGSLATYIILDETADLNFTLPRIS